MNFLAALKVHCGKTRITMVNWPCRLKECSRLGVFLLSYFDSKLFSLSPYPPYRWAKRNLKKSNGHNSDLGWEELDELESRARVENTKRATAWCPTNFEKWRDKRKIEVNLKIIIFSTLNEFVRNYAEVKTENRKQLSPCALTGIRAALHHSL